MLIPPDDRWMGDSKWVSVGRLVKIAFITKSDLLFPSEKKQHNIRRKDSEKWFWWLWESAKNERRPLFETQM